MLRRTLASSSLAFAAFVPWAFHQHADTGDWLGLTETKAATRAGIGLLARLGSLPRLATLPSVSATWRTFVFPGTWSAMGAPVALAAVTAAGMIVLWVGPQLGGSRRFAERKRAWWGSAAALGFFALADVGHATSFAVTGGAGGVGDGWYFLTLLPVFIAGGAFLGREAQARQFLAASLLFLAVEGFCLFRLLPAAYSGGRANRTGLATLSRVGLVPVPAVALAAIAALGLAAIVIAGIQIFRATGETRSP